MDRSLQRKLGKTNYQHIKRLCRDRGQLFEDTDFPPGNRAVYSHKRPALHPIVWMRPHVSPDWVYNSLGKLWDICAKSEHVCNCILISLYQTKPSIKRDVSLILCSGQTGQGIGTWNKMLQHTRQPIILDLLYIPHAKKFLGQSHREMLYRWIWFNCSKCLLERFLSLQISFQQLPVPDVCGFLGNLSSHVCGSCINSRNRLSCCAAASDFSPLPITNVLAWEEGSISTKIPWDVNILNGLHSLCEKNVRSEGL